jgi:alpha-D-xyloside xylohydrolase
MSAATTGDLCFPQRATVEIQEPNPLTEAKQRQKGPWFFKDGENVHFMRAEAVSSAHYQQDRGFLDLELETKLYVNRTAQTHDSVMHQFIDGKGEAGTIWLRVYFFTQDIFRVQFSISRGALDALQQEPEFPFPAARMLVQDRKAIQVDFKELQAGFSLESSSVKVHIESKPFQISAHRQGDKMPFWKQRLGDIFTSDVLPTSVARHAGREATFEAFQLSPGESIYGLGERFDAVARRGRPVDFVNHDVIGTSNPRSYINVPLLWSTAGYGCFVNSYARTEWDVGMTDTGTVGLSTEENFMDYFIISGKTPKDILQRYTRDLTGQAVMPPIWTYGLWFSRNSYTSWSVVDEVLKQCSEKNVPIDVIHLDTAWFKEDWNPDLVFGRERFPDPEIKIPKLLEDGVHTSLWQCTFVPPRDDNVLYKEGLAGGYFAYAREADGSKGSKLFEYPAGSSGWRLDDATIDYSNPKTRAWYGKKISDLVAMGVSAIKTDFGDCITPDAFYENIEGRRFQNLYALAYNATISAAMKSVNSDTVVWSRGGTAGSQRYPIHWGGDSQCSWAALQGSFNATLSLGLSGFTFVATDCGGFIGTPAPELYIRWSQLSLLAASHFRSHGAGDTNSREPWAFGDDALDTFKHIADLRYQLLPYIVEQSRLSCDAGVGVIRHLVLEWPEDRNTWHIETQCMLGDGIMIVPVMRPLSELDETMDVYFPKGKWYDFWTKKLFLETNGQWAKVPTPATNRMSIWVRGSSAICYAIPGRQRTHNQVGDVVKVECFDGPSDGSNEWNVGDGAGGTIRLHKGSKGSWDAEEGSNIEVKTYVD